MTVTDWFASPILNVTDVEASLRFYIDRIGFTNTQRRPASESGPYNREEPTANELRSGLPRVDYGHACGLEVIHISGYDRHAVNKGSGCNESVTIGARTGHVERGAPLGNSSINRENATFERGQNIAIHPGAKNCALFLVTPFDEEDSYLQFQD